MSGGSETGVAPLRLPHGRRIVVTGDARDVTVLEHLRQADGDWEPHVQALLERLVRPEWVCFDVGANIGAHTLTLAALATAGHVVAFEASARNYAHLTANATRLPTPKARITPVHCALWDEAGSLNLAESGEFSGNAFVADQVAGVEAATIDGSQHVRPIGNREVNFTLHVHSVPAVRLDDWVADHGVDRLDLVKLDVEGAEAHVLAGAALTLRRFRPVVVTEYNPACATDIFGAEPEAYYGDLLRFFRSVHLIEPDGTLSDLPNWGALRARIEQGSGWEDLLCVP